MRARKQGGDLLGHKTKRAKPNQVDGFDQDVARIAFEAAVDRVARLTTYASARDLAKFPDAVTDRCLKLATDDLVIGAISLRRLTEACHLHERCKNIGVPLATIAGTGGNEHGQRNGEISLWRLLGIIVHSRRIHIADRSTILAVLAGHTFDELHGRLLDPPRSIEPFCIVKSDKQLAHFLLGDFAWRAAQLLEIAEDVCGDNGLHLWLD